MYTLDTTEARKADSTGTAIKEMGKYIGQFTQAEDVTASTGTKGVALTFESNGQKTRFTLYTTKANGEKIMGLQTLMAIMTCLHLRDLTPSKSNVKSYNMETRQEETKPGTVFPDICNKPIGVLLETEDYVNKKGEMRTRLVCMGAFQAATELTASEILDKKTTPEQLVKMVAYMRHRPMKNSPVTRTIAPAATAPVSGFDDMDDDIPF